MSDLQTSSAEAAEKAFAAAAESVAVSKPAAKIETVSFPPKAARAPAGASPTVTPKAPKKPAAKKAAAVSPKAPAKAAAAKKPAANKAAAKKVAAAKPAATVHQFPSLSQIKDQTMTKTTEMTEDLKKFASEAQTKAKAAVAKGKVVLTDAGEFTKGNVEALVASGKILGQGVKALGEEAIADTRAALSPAATSTPWSPPPARTAKRWSSWRTTCSRRFRPASPWRWKRSRRPPERAFAGAGSRSAPQDRDRVAARRPVPFALRRAG